MLIEQIISEKLSNILYHATSISTVLNILKSDSFRLTPDLGTKADARFRKKDKIYYMSFARSKTGAYHYPVGWQGALLFIDGDKLSQRYSGGPVDYWNDNTKDEMEDRLYSKNGYIQNASEYIKEIHLYVEQDKEDYRTAKLIRWARQIYIEGNRKNIPVYFYSDANAYNLLDKRNATDISKISLPPIDPTDKPYQRQSRNNYSPYMELLSVSDKDKLSKEAEDKLYKMAGWYKQDAIRSLSADIHNDKNSPDRKNLDKFLEKAKQLKLRSVEDIVNYIIDKFEK